MKIEQLQEQGAQVVCLDGQFDAVAAPDAEQSLLRWAESADAPVVLDMTRLEYIGSLGLQALLRFSRALQQREAALCLCGLNPFVQQVFEISQFVRLFEIRPTRAEALAALAAEPSQRPDGG